MKLNPRLLINLITVLLLGVLTVGWVIVRLVGGGAFEERFRVTVDFATSGGVFTNQEVTYRGVLIGKVGRMSLNTDGVDVELDIEPEWRGRIPEDVAVTVQSKSAVGEQFVNLTPLSDSSDKLEDGDVIARERTSLPVDFQELLSSLDRVLSDVPPETTQRLIGNLAEGLKGRAEDIAVILESLGTLSDAFASVAPEQQRLLDNATRAGSEFLATKDEFARAIRAADRVFAGLGDEPEELSRLLQTNDRLAREGIDLLARHGGALHDGISSLADLVEYQLREKEEVLKSLEYTPQFLRAIEDASVPWRSPDGREFYRIRVGLVYDNVEATWPCKYELPPEYDRHYFVRDRRDVPTEGKCVEPDEGATTAETSFLAAMDRYQAEEVTIAAATGAVPAAIVDGPGFMWPLDGAVTSGFGPRWGRSHEGIDIDGLTGDPVVASASGRVVLAAPYGGYGNAVVVDHGDGVRTLYAHLSAFDVTLGQEVTKGQTLGAVGCSGHCFGDHLHFEIVVDGIPVDPLLYLPGGPLFVVGTELDHHPDPEEASPGSVELEVDGEADIGSAAP